MQKMQIIDVVSARVGRMERGESLRGNWSVIIKKSTDSPPSKRYSQTRKGKKSGRLALFQYKTQIFWVMESM
jgi:hypothetical protein